MSSSSTLADTSPVTPNGGTLQLNPSLENLQTDEQRQVLDTVAQVRKCGLETILSLPQLVVCGDQSAGKSSVLEALTEIPFERNDNLCTRYATEIILRRAPVSSLTIKVIPDTTRPALEQAKIRAFKEYIQEFSELPRVMELAMDAMGLDPKASAELQGKAFARDVLSIEIEGPTTPQLTLVDIPGLVQTATKGVTEADVELVAEITQQYISQPRTICLAVISATNDYANQKILTKVREVDPEGNRTLGIITKPDLIPQGSGSEEAFLSLARNEDVVFKLGWHVLKNRRFEEGAFSLLERNHSEAVFFQTSNFKALPKDNVGIESLRVRLSALLYSHVKKELPNLQKDLNVKRTETTKQLEAMGESRNTVVECRTYLSSLSLEYHGICKAAVEGHYEGDYFSREVDAVFSIKSARTIRRLRAVVQYMNQSFAEDLRLKGHKYNIESKASTPTSTTPAAASASPQSGAAESEHIEHEAKASPIKLPQKRATAWVSQVLLRTRGKELIGNFNPLLIGELFWEQSVKWHQMAENHAAAVARMCRTFLKTLLDDKCPEDIRPRLWQSVLEESLQQRMKSAADELQKIVDDLKSYPINYNHYYTDTIQKRRTERAEKELTAIISAATTRKKGPHCSNVNPSTAEKCTASHTSDVIDVQKIVQSLSKHTEVDMTKYACEEALDDLEAIYKVLMKTFLANVTVQVIERHIVRALETIFSPVTVSRMSDVTVVALVSEPASVKKQRAFLEDMKSKLENGRSILRDIM